MAAAVKEEEADPSINRQSPPPRQSMVTHLQPKDLPHRPCLWILSEDATALIAIDCLSDDDDAPRFYSFRLPYNLHGRYLYSPVGPFLRLEETDFDLLGEEVIQALTGVRLVDPFNNWTEFAPLPPSASIRPGCNVILQTVVLDINRGITLGFVGNFSSRLVYTTLDEGVDPVTRTHRTHRGGTWTNITHLLSGHSISGCDIYLRSAILHQDGLFYAVDRTGNKVFALDFSSPRRPTLDDVTFDLRNNFKTTMRVDSCCYQSASLINSGPSVFLVRWRNTLRADGVNVPREIDVFRLEVGLKRWVPMKSLGNQSFFIGATSSFSLSIEDFPDLKSNRVYICHDPMTRISGNPFACPYRFGDTDSDSDGDGDGDADSDSDGDGDADSDSFRRHHHLLCNLEDGSWGKFFDKSWIPEDFTPTLSMMLATTAHVWMLPPTGASTGLS